jgi:hypothetical protein
MGMLDTSSGTPSSEATFFRNGRSWGLGNRVFVADALTRIKAEGSKPGR